MALERTNVVLQKKVLEMKRQGMSIRKPALSLRACRKTVSKIYARDDQGLPPEQPRILNETFKDVDWNHVVLNVTERHVPIKTLCQEAKEEHGSYCAFITRSTPFQFFKGYLNQALAAKREKTPTGAPKRQTETMYLDHLQGGVTILPEGGQDD